MAHRRSDPTNSVASRERSAMRDAKRDIRIDDAKAVGGIEDKRKGD